MGVFSSLLYICPLIFVVCILLLMPIVNGRENLRYFHSSLGQMLLLLLSAIIPALNFIISVFLMYFMFALIAKIVPESTMLNSYPKYRKSK